MRRWFQGSKLCRWLRRHESESTPSRCPTSHGESPVIQVNPKRGLLHNAKSNHPIPQGFDKILNHERNLKSSTSPPIPPQIDPVNTRYRLHVREQPAAARACCTYDRNRRLIDPSPIVQIILIDFDPKSQSDKVILQDPRLTVGCFLFPLFETTGLSQQSCVDEEKTKQCQTIVSENCARIEGHGSTPLLSGKAFVSPFYVDADPDPNTAPSHPSSDPMQSATPIAPHPHPHLRNASKLRQPATFFIFTDLSIRFAGFYQLKFQLMNWGSVEDTGQAMPILAEAWSDPFRLYVAKDFPGMRDSSILAEGLKDLGFSELKTRGIGKGKGRRRRLSSQ